MAGIRAAGKRGAIVMSNLDHRDDARAAGPGAPSRDCTGPGCCGGTSRREFLQIVGSGSSRLAGGGKRFGDGRAV